MSVLDTFAKRVAERKEKVRGDGNNLNGGATYELEVESVTVGPGFSKKLNRESSFITPTFKVVSTEVHLDAESLAKLPSHKRPNAPGSTAAMPLCLEEDWSMDKAIKILAAVTDEPISELDKQRDDGTGSGKTTTLIKEIVSEAQPLKGCRVMCDAFEKPLKGKENSTNPSDFRTRHKFFHNDSTKAATAQILG